MRIEPTSIRQRINVLNTNHHNRSSVNTFKGGKGAIIGGVTGSALVTGALFTTIALSGPIGWILAGWTATAGAVAGGVVGSNAEDSIKDRFSKK